MAHRDVLSCRGFDAIEAPESETLARADHGQQGRRRGAARDSILAVVHGAFTSEGLEGAIENEDKPMKKLVIGAVAAVIAAMSFASTASAGQVVLKYKDGFRHHNRAVVVVRPRAHVVVRPRARVYIAPRVVYRDACWTKKTRRVNQWGNVVVKRVRVCR
jgi:hypothetical protein